MKELIVSYTRKDFRVDTFPSGGPGGQHQNKTDSGVRITHIPSGLASECRETRSQHQNKQIAFQKLAKKVKQWHIANETTEEHRSTETIRTYHKVENRVKDHASGHRQSYDAVMDDITEMIEARAVYMVELTRNK